MSSASGLVACLWASAAFVLAAGLLALLLPARAAAHQAGRAQGSR